MIFVTTGINGAPFDRLLRVIDDFRTDEEVVVQHGPSALRPSNATCVGFLSFDELNRLVAQASRVITHAGVGSVLVTLAHGKRPTVVPRLPEYGEVVDRHQLSFSRHLSDAGLADLIEDPRLLAQHIETRPQPPPTGAGEAALVWDLSSYLSSICGRDANDPTHAATPTHQLMADP